MTLRTRILRLEESLGFAPGTELVEVFNMDYYFGNPDGRRFIPASQASVFDRVWFYGNPPHDPKVIST